MKFDVVSKEFKLNTLKLSLSEICGVKGNDSCLEFAISNNFSAGMHSDIYALIWFKLGMLIETIELYILVLV